MSIRNRLQTQMHRLTAADHRLLRVILADAGAAAGLSISELSRKADVHAASAVRLARRLGYTGYPELRADLQAEVVANRAPSARLQHTLDKAGTGEILDQLIHAERRSLARIADHLGHSDLALAADALIGATRIAVFAQGHADVLAALALRRLTRSGYATIDLRRRGRDLSERLGALQRSDALLVFTLRRLPPDAQPLLVAAAQVGARVVLISDQLGWALSPRPHVILSAPRGEEADYQTLTVPMAILNAMLLAIASRDDGRTLSGLARTAALTRMFEEERH